MCMHTHTHNDLVSNLLFNRIFVFFKILGYECLSACVHTKHTHDVFTEAKVGVRSYGTGVTATMGSSARTERAPNH